MDRSSRENLILVNREPNAIAYLTINRPRSLNSLTRPMMRDLAQAFKSLDNDESVRASPSPPRLRSRWPVTYASLQKELSSSILMLDLGYSLHEGYLRNFHEQSEEVAEAILKNKSAINDGLKLDLGQALALEQERAHEYYNGMTKEQFQKMQDFIAGRASKNM
ncbi:putative enoyl-CoA hydratase 1, peroxisomal, partial [Cucurbita argyrosperma subsp. sororia]